MIRIKICGMYDPLNVKRIAEARPDFMGFIFYPGSPRYIGTEPDPDLFLNVPSDILKTGVFVNENLRNVLDLAFRTGLNLIQLHGNESPAYCYQLRSSGLKIIKTFSVTGFVDFELLEPYVPACDYFLFDTKTEKFGGSGIKFDWGKIAGYHLDKPFFISGGIGPEDSGLLRTLENKGFFAVDVNSRFETSPGIKNISLLKTFIDDIKKEQL